MKRFQKKDLFTIPNIMSYARILLIPVFCVLYLKEQYLWAAIVVAVSSLTDLFDGMIARKFNQVTELGKALDPIADKLSHAALAICIAIRYPLMWALIGLMAVKEGYMGIMGLYFLKRGKMLDGAKWYGKVCTASLFIGLLLLLVLPIFWDVPIALVNTIIIVLMAFMLFTLIMYIPVFRKMKADYDREQAAR